MMAQGSTNMEFPMPEPYVDADVASRHLSAGHAPLAGQQKEDS